MVSTKVAAVKVVAKLKDAENANDSKYRRRLRGVYVRGQSCYWHGERAKVADDNAVVSLVTAAKAASRRRICRRCQTFFGRVSHGGVGPRLRKNPKCASARI
jgi:hypothetical protein